MRRVELDFWNPGSLLKGISQVYKVSETSIIQLMTEFGNQQDFLSAFLKDIIFIQMFIALMECLLSAN